MLCINCQVIDTSFLDIMTQNNKIQDLLYFKGIIEDYNIKLESIKNEKVDDENLKIVVLVIK